MRLSATTTCDTPADVRQPMRAGRAKPTILVRIPMISLRYAAFAALTMTCVVAEAGQSTPSELDEFVDALAAGGSAPTMVRVPGGTFLQGSSKAEVGRDDDEGPQREVRIQPFALGKTELSRAEFARFVAATGYRTDAERDTVVPSHENALGCFTHLGEGEFGWKEGANWMAPGYPQMDDHPAVCLSWNDANAYVDWLAEQTGLDYRLPTESELEYAIRAGSSTTWSWGATETAACTFANHADQRAEAEFPEWNGSACDDGAAYTAPVGSRKPNGYGLHDASGNVWEWAADCAHKSYSGAPTDGSSWLDANGGDCSYRVIRGGSWDDALVWLRVANRSADPIASRFYYSGLRIACSLWDPAGADASARASSASASDAAKMVCRRRP